MSESTTFSFKNLQPLNYLKTFNKMVQYNSRNCEIENKDKQLKTRSLSKFPLHEFYYKMQGIFENTSKKTMEVVDKKKKEEEIYQQEFLNKHNNFMKKVISKIICDNEQHQQILTKCQKYYRKNQIDKFRSRSQLKLKNNSKNHVIHQKVDENDKLSILTAKATSEERSVTFKSTEIKNKHKSVLPELQPRKKKEKFKSKDDEKIKQFIEKRKSLQSQRELSLTPYQSLPAPLTSREKGQKGTEKNKNKIDEQNEEETTRVNIAPKEDFVNEIIKLQLVQQQKQSKLGKKIEENIAQFNKKMNIQVHSINYYSFW